MELIERYIHAVTEQLPEGMKDDVGKELRGNIEDMLPEQYTEDDVKSVLEELGNPWKIAEEYQPKPRYLIGPTLYGKYFTVLKLVVGIVMTVLAAITIIGWVFMPATVGIIPTNYIDMLIELIVSLINGGLQAALWVTLVFVVIERRGSGKSEGLSGKEEVWSVRDLPQLPVQSKKIPRSGTIVSIIGTLLVTAVFYINPQLIGIFSRSHEGEYTIYPLLETDRLQSYLPIILVLAVVHLVLFIWKYIVQYWNYRIWTMHIILSVLVAILIIVMVNDPALIREGFFADAAQLLEVSLASVLSKWDTVVRIFVVVIVVITVWDGLDTFLKTRKK
jgi:hypothetical protein